MKSMNRVQFIGHLGKDPILNDVSGTAVAKFSIATSESYKDDKGEWHTRTQWHNVVVWGRKAEQVCQYCEKGSKIYMEGKLVHREYQDKEGRTIYVTEVNMLDFSLASAKKVNSKLEQPYIPIPPELGDDDDLPF